MKINSRILVRLALTLAAIALSSFAEKATAAAFTNSGSLNPARAAHGAVLLPKGKVLVVGGRNGTDRLASAELYDPATGTWTNTGSLATGRNRLSVTLLTNGLVLAVGGATGQGPTATCELFDPASGIWTNTGSMVTARGRQTATLLLNGKVLITGGSPDAGVTSLSSAELFNPATGTWTNTSSMGTARDLDTATLLLSGKALVVGGSATGDSAPALASAELYDPATGTWTPTGSLNVARTYHTATLLPDGRVLVAGGEDGITAFSSAELYDPATGTWTATGPLESARSVHTATLLSDGTVLAAAGYHYGPSDPIGSLSSAELYTPSARTWTATGSLNAAGSFQTATLLTNGQVLISAGYDDSASVWLSSAELYDSASGTITLVNPVKLPNGGYRIAFTGTPNGTNTVLATTNPTLPLANWTALGVAQEFSPGLYLFTDLQAMNTSQRFYCVRSP